MTYDPQIEHTSPRRQVQPPADPTLAVVVAQLEYVREDIKGLREEVRSTSTTYVPRGEWVQRNLYVDGTFASQGREISQLRAEVQSKRTPWPAVAGAVTGALSLIVVLIQNIS